MENKYDDTFLAKWLNNELTPLELEEFKKSPNFSLYEKIADKSSELSVPTFEKEKLFAKIQNKVHEEKKGKVKPLFTRWMYGAAASVVILLGLVYYLTLSTVYETGFGEQLAFKLPDASEVILNSKSSVSFNEKLWKKSRSINLVGEAYFKVKKGSKFVVTTKEGFVTVLGTQFNVNTKKNFIEVKCFEGKVKVKSVNDEAILTQGKAFRQIEKTSEKWSFKEQQPSWKLGETNFTSTPLKYVIKALENQFDIKFNTSRIDLNQRYTGSFTHENLNIALQTVFAPMKIEATFVDEKTVLLVKQ
ncbi:hypothetical protein WH52_07415 [Tenacibaculum holothuriorum]|uniref:Uncharacterized protein n=1 Tax=Tenacibaculum holothuriorum TaxID=1635173 RepID=A0A1Y2PDQ6_9FLAO|nr:FecR family protein [Tenacibaculum holothuriorum]OSY88565.1 hypothetical protein WH52_07415 [Tenacibaculum holothuriorum]